MCIQCIHAWKIESVINVHLSIFYAWIHACVGVASRPGYRERKSLPNHVVWSQASVGVGGRLVWGLEGG